MSLFLIVNADDFGITEGANRAIVAAHNIGNVTSACLLANMPAASHAMNLAKLHPELGVGWHANLTLGKPVSEPSAVPSLVDANGLFYARGVMEFKLLLRRVDVADIRRELNAQFDHFLNFGRRPTHIDSHQNMHAFPVFFDVLAEIAVREGLPIRMPWRWPGPQRRDWKRRIRTGGMQWLLRRNARHWHGRIHGNTGLCSLFDLTYRPEDIATPLYERLLRAYDSGVVELVVHPAEVDDELRSMSRITKFSARENEWLKTPELKRIAQANGFELTNYADARLWKDA
jgi:chitin disaccharide deacetylase